MYILKVKGSAKIPDYIQIRDDKFTLIAYFIAKNVDNVMDKIEISLKLSDIKKIIIDIPYGKIYKF